MTGPTFLVFGGKGWIGSLVVEELKKQGANFNISSARLENREAVIADIDKYKPTNVLNCAGVTGRPNVDWCEDHKTYDRHIFCLVKLADGDLPFLVGKPAFGNKIECIRGNILGTINLADICAQRDIHMMYYGTGCIFHYDDEYTVQSGKGFKEDDKPNFTGSYYSHCKAITENLLQAYPGVLTLRVRMPIVADLLYPRNFITKIIKYDKVINIPNSMTVLPELIPYSIEMSKRKLTGIMNYTNPGAISHNEILELYKEYIDPDFSWENFTVEEQARVIVAPRSNNLLDTARMKGEFPELLGIKESLIKYVFEPNAKEKEEVKAAVDKMRDEFRAPKAGNTA